MAEELLFGPWLQRRRKALDLTREELAGKVGCSISALRKIEADTRRPSRQLAVLLADALHLSGEEAQTFVRVARGERSVEQLHPAPPAAGISSLQGSPLLSFPLPVPPTQLVGREQELSALRQMRADDRCRLITLVGPGGSGKTRLALEAAWEADGSAAFVSLASVASASLLVPAIGDALGLTFCCTMDQESQLLDYLRDKQILLILDNMEHLLKGAACLAAILESAPKVKLLCTSREPLNLRGEWVFEIGGLPVPKEIHSLTAEADNSVALFIQRARQLNAAFECDEAEAPAVLDICRLVEGMPLAIELAASWVRALSCREIREEIERNMDFLSTTMRDVPERHRSMQAVFDHSWILITPEERRALSALSIFRGGFTRDAAEQVAGANLDVLSALVAKSLVQRRGEKRFSLHNLVRQYAARQLEAEGGTEEAQRRHMAFFARFAETGRQQFTGPLITIWLQHMERENDNLRAALDHSLALQDSQTGLRLGAAMWRFWECRGFVDEGRRWLSAVLTMPDCDSEEHALQRARTLNAAGALARIQGDFSQAHRFHEESLALRRRAGDIPGISESLNSLGVLTTFEGQYAAASAYFKESLQLCRELGRKAEIARRLNNLGVATMYQGDYEQSRSLHEETMALYRELGDRHGEAGSLGNLGDVLRYQGQYDRAMQFLTEGLEILREVGDVHGMAVTLGSIARVHLAKGETAEALASFHAGLKRNREVGDKTEMASDLEGIADALGARARQPAGPEDELRLAVRFLGAASQMRDVVGAPRSAAECVEFERIMARMRSNLAEEDVRAELRRGAAMTSEQALEAALFHLSRYSDPAGVT
ncbi:MAG: ATP-binding protein [Bacteroidota bacterium]